MNLRNSIHVFVACILLSYEVGAVALCWILWLFFPRVFQDSGAWLMNQPEYIKYGVFVVLGASFYFCFDAHKDALNPIEGESLKNLYEWPEYRGLKFAIYAGTVECGLCVIAYALILYIASSASLFMVSTASVIIFSAISCVSVIAAAQKIKEFLVLNKP